MKKLALILAIAMLIPVSAFGMQIMNNSSMDQITGQSGVSIALDDVQVFINIDKLAYIDSDGLTTASSYTVNGTSGAAGAIYLNNFQIDVLNVNAIVATQASGAGITGASAGNDLISTTTGKIALFYTYATDDALTNDSLNGTSTNQTQGLDNLKATFVSAALTIDVTDKLPALTQGFQYNTSGSTPAVTVGGVIIGLPTLEVYINNMNLTPKYTGDVDGLTSTAVNNNKDYGTVEIDGLTLTILSGWVEIAPH